MSAEEVARSRAPGACLHLVLWLCCWEREKAEVSAAARAPCRPHLPEGGIVEAGTGRTGSGVVSHHWPLKGLAACDLRCGSMAAWILQVDPTCSTSLPSGQQHVLSQVP